MLQVNVEAELRHDSNNVIGKDLFQTGLLSFSKDLFKDLFK